MVLEINKVFARSDRLTGFAFKLAMLQYSEMQSAASSLLFFLRPSCNSKRNFDR